MTIFDQTSAAETSTVTVTLSRAHKINERINAKLNELRTSAAAKGLAVNVQVHSGPEQVELIRAGAAQALAIAPVYVALVAAQAALRTAVASVNVATGITDVLTAVEKNKRLVTLCDTFITLAPTANTLSPEALAARPLGEQVKDYGSVAVSGFTAAHLEPYVKAKEQLERDNFALQDKLSDLNAHKVSFEVSEDVLELLSLKGA
jgi:hypothetical protein